jgi:hypothetical protein
MADEMRRADEGNDARVVRARCAAETSVISAMSYLFGSEVPAVGTDQVSG